MSVPCVCVRNTCHVYNQHDRITSVLLFASQTHHRYKINMNTCLSLTFAYQPHNFQQTQKTYFEWTMHCIPYNSLHMVHDDVQTLQAASLESALARKGSIRMASRNGMLKNMMPEDACVEPFQPCVGLLPSAVCSCSHPCMLSVVTPSQRLLCLLSKQA